MKLVKNDPEAYAEAGRAVCILHRTGDLVKQPDGSYCRFQLWVYVTSLGRFVISTYIQRVNSQGELQKMPRATCRFVPDASYISAFMELNEVEVEPLMADYRPTDATLMPAERQILGQPLNKWSKEQRIRIWSALRRR